MQPEPSWHEPEKPSTLGDQPDSEPTFSGRIHRFFDCTDEQRLREALATKRPVELEIGSGKGLFLCNAAKQNSEHMFIGLELATKFARESQERLEHQKIHNACFVACDAVSVLERDIADSSIRTIHVYFPDPWWKSRHKKRRVLSDGTLINIERTLISGGELMFWTDVLDYYEETLELIDQVTSLNGPSYVPEPESTHDMDYRTHFERRTRKNGLPVYRARFQKCNS